jgi:peptidyl-tRNA hydrolase
MKYREIAEKWHTESNYVIALGIPDQRELEMLARKAEKKGITVVRFYEPDIDNQLTSICLEPCEATRRITSHLPLLLKEKEVVELAA